MTVGDIRRMTEGMPDSAPVILHMISCPQDDLNVVVEDICPSADRSRLNLNVSVVPDEELDDYLDEGDED